MQLGDVDEVFARFQAARQQVLSSVAPASAQAALQRLLPNPARCVCAADVNVGNNAEKVFLDISNIIKNLYQ